MPYPVLSGASPCPLSRCLECHLSNRIQSLAYSCVNPVVVCKCEWLSSLLCVYRILSRSFALCFVVALVVHLTYLYTQVWMQCHHSQALCAVVGGCKGEANPQSVLTQNYSLPILSYQGQSMMGSSTPQALGFPTHHTNCILSQTQSLIALLDKSAVSFLLLLNLFLYPCTRL